MTSFGPVTGDVRGNVQFKEGQVTFENGFDALNDGGDIWHVDGSLSSGAANGKTWADAFTTIQAAITAASHHDIIFIRPKLITDFTGDPASYEENLIIPAATNNLSIIGVSRGRTQGGLPQLKDGSGTTTAILIIRAPGCLIKNIGINGAGNTGGGILLDDDYSAKSAFGTTIVGCHFKNCKGHATDGRLGGAIMWSAQGNAWQVYIGYNRFYKNVTDICLIGTGSTRPQDVVIEHNIFSGSASSTDCNIYGYSVGGGGFGHGLIINDNVFGSLPALSSGSILRYVALTGTQSGMITNNVFGCVTDQAGTELTFKVAGTGGIIPITVFLARNYGQSITDGVTGEINIS